MTPETAPPRLIGIVGKMLGHIVRGGMVGGLVGALLGGLFGGCFYICLLLEALNASISLSWTWRDIVDAVAFGGIGGGVLGVLLGLLVFSGAAWRIAMSPERLRGSGSEFRSLTKLVSLGQATGALAGSLTLTVIPWILMTWFGTNASTPGNLSTLDTVFLSGISNGSALGMLAGGLLGAVVANHRARYQERLRSIEGS